MAEEEGSIEVEVMEEVESVQEGGEKRLWH